MKQINQKLTLDRPVSYQIEVQGHLDNSWLDWIEGMTIAVKCDAGRPPFTTLNCVLDQAALQGLLRRLYALGLPLISVIWLKGP